MDNLQGPLSGTPPLTIVDAPQPPLSWFQNRRWEALKIARDAAIDAGVETPFGTFDSDPQSRANLGDAVLAARISQDPAFSIEWTLADNTSVTLSAEQLVTVGLLVMQHVNQQHAIGRAKRAAVYAATSIEEVEAIVW